MAKTSEAALSSLLDATIVDLTARVKSGEATSGDYKNIIQLLKDNGITCEIKKGSPFGELVESLPFTAESDQKYQ